MDLYSDTVLNVRIRMPIQDGINNRDFIAKILKYKKICDVPNSMSVLPVLLPVLVDMMLNKHTGTINLVNKGIISHNEILDMYKTHIDPSFTWENISIDEQNKILMSKRSNNCISTQKLEKLYPNIPDIKSAILNIILNMKFSI
jgi:hypothetical protein